MTLTEKATGRSRKGKNVKPSGTLYYAFPIPDDSYMPSFRDLDLRRFELLTSTVRL